MVRQIKVRGIVLHEGKLLCVRLKPYNEALKQDNSFWCLPGGTLDEGEALLDCIKREMIEETGITPTVGSLLYIQQFADNEKDYTEFFFHITNGHDYLNIDLSNTTHGDLEIEEIGFINPSDGRRVMPRFLSSENLTEQAGGKPTKVISNL